MAMGTPLTSSFRQHSHVAVCSFWTNVKLSAGVLPINYHSGIKIICPRSLIVCSFSKARERYLCKPIFAVGSGLEATLTDPKDNDVSIKTAEITVESKDGDKMQVRVDLSGKETQIVFEKILRNLARTAPPVPGFRREKGGQRDLHHISAAIDVLLKKEVNFRKTTKISKKSGTDLSVKTLGLKQTMVLSRVNQQYLVPKDFLLQILGEDRVTNFVIQEIVTSTLADYVKKENLTVKDNKVKTKQTAEELKSVFIPGNDFGFNATLELEKSVEGSVEVEKTV